MNSPPASRTARMASTPIVIGPEASLLGSGPVRNVGAGRPDAPGLPVGAGAATQSGGSGPGGAGKGPSGTGSSTPRSASQPFSNAAVSTPSAALNAASSLTPSP